MVPILICIPFWTGDRGQATELCKIIAGLQAHHVGTVAHVLLVNRQDCAQDPNMLKIISAKFNTFTLHSNSPLKGWPNGSNGMFGSTMIHVAVYGLQYECIFWCEPDCTPLRPNWFWDLVLEWRRRHPAANIVGCRHDCNGDGTGDHITGCALYHPQIGKILPCITMCDHIAWDYQHRDKIVAMGGHTELIRNRYRATAVEPTILDDSACLIHGIKGTALTDLVKKKYKIA